MPRPTLLNDPEEFKRIVEMFANGDTREDIANTFGITKQTVTVWRKDPRVKRAVHQLRSERVSRVTTKVDAIIEARLHEFAGEMTIKELLEIRKGFMSDGTRVKLDDADETTINAAAAAAEDPDFMEKLRELTGE